LINTLVLALFAAGAALLVPKLAGPGFPPRSTALLVIGLFMTGLALCGSVNRFLFRKRRRAMKEAHPGEP
jgi:O-antigen/teichoic acid export membrane protein